jgi:hypothetical protein
MSASHCCLSFCMRFGSVRLNTIPKRIRRISRCLSSRCEWILAKMYSLILSVPWQLNRVSRMHVFFFNILVKASTHGNFNKTRLFVVVQDYSSSCTVATVQCLNTSTKSERIHWSRFYEIFKVHDGCVHWNLECQEIRYNGFNMGLKESRVQLVVAYDHIVGVTNLKLSLPV